MRDSVECFDSIEEADVKRRAQGDSGVKCGYNTKESRHGALIVPEAILTLMKYGFSP